MFKFGTTDRFSFLAIGFFYFSTLIIGYYFINKGDELKEINHKSQKMLVHLVLIKFKDETSTINLQKITDAAYDLQRIPRVENLNYGNNVSPEGLNKGYSHSLTMKFTNSKDRDSIYLPHPIHRNFVKLFLQHTESVLVYDFWE
tara:strand:- start:882 stop:1313 length:432 start_codon:yes stop_codon:yes gene_type:complete